MYCVYILIDKERKIYIGCTSDIKKRLKLHLSGDVRSTKNRRDLRLIYCEVFVSKEDAFKREAMLKYHAQAWRRLKERLKNTFDKF
jgi:putative endonuclease